MTRFGFPAIRLSETLLLQEQSATARLGCGDAAEILKKALAEIKEGGYPDSELPPLPAVFTVWITGVSPA